MAAEGEEKFCFTESLYIFWNNAATWGPLAILKKFPPEPIEQIRFMTDSVIRITKLP